MNTVENSIEEALNPNIGEIILYQPDSSLRLEVRIAAETVWLNRQQMSQLFDRDVKTIGKHINNALSEELIGLPTVAKFATVQMEGNRMVEREIEHYNLDMVLSVGYRVKSQRGVQFRIWSNRVLKEYLLRGYAINQRIERAENFAIETERRVTETEKKIEFLAHYIESVLADYNDINEDTQVQLELINEALAKLQSDHHLTNKPRNPIGFRTDKLNN